MKSLLLLSAAFLLAIWMLRIIMKNNLNYSTKEELKELIAAKLSVEEIMDILGWTNIELVDALEEYIMEMEDDFKDAIEY